MCVECKNDARTHLRLPWHDSHAILASLNLLLADERSHVDRDLHATILTRFHHHKKNKNKMKCQTLPGLREKEKERVWVRWVFGVVELSVKEINSIGAMVVLWIVMFLRIVCAEDKERKKALWLQWLVVVLREQGESSYSWRRRRESGGRVAWEMWMACNQGVRVKLYGQQQPLSFSLCHHCNVPVQTVASSTSFMTPLSHFAPLLFTTALSTSPLKSLGLS